MNNTGADVLSFRNVVFGYAGYAPVIEDFSASLREGEIVCVIGASGCGKTTLLNLAGGFLMPDCGEVYDRHGIVEAPSPSRVMVFQDSSQLFPWLTVMDNVLFPDRTASERAERLLRLVGLSNAAGFYPSCLSGGMKQRAVIARALAPAPEVLLLDEPFTALDAPTRRGLQDMLLELNEETGTSMLFVTHDIREAVYLSDRLLIMTESGVKKMEISLDRGPGRRDEFSDKFVQLERRVFSEISFS